MHAPLSALEEEGAVERRDAPRRGSARRGSSVFAITGDGQKRLRELLQQPIQRTPPRNGLLLRLFFGRHLGPELCEEMVRGARADAEAQLTQLEAFRTGLDHDQGAADDRPYWLLTISAGEHSARAAIAWADETLAALGQMDASSTPKKPRRR